MYGKEYINHIYQTVKKDCAGLDSIYEDYIVHLVGMHGLVALQKHNLLETCGAVQGRQLYVLNEVEGDKHYGINN